MTVTELRKVIAIWISLYQKIYPHSSLLSEYVHPSRRILADAYEQKEFLLDSLSTLEMVESLRHTAVEDNLREAIVLAQLHQHHHIPAIHRNLMIVHQYIETIPVIK
ncbi:MAG: hypothetical protein ACM3Q4_00550 [Acidobacteriota bacterium]